VSTDAPRSDGAADIKAEVAAWAKRSGVQSVVWTNLPPKIGTEERTPTSDEVVNYLRKLRGEKRSLAETYVRETPRQIDTEYRRDIEAELGWTPKGRR
jgi:hypothetical protein